MTAHYTDYGIQIALTQSSIYDLKNADNANWKLEE